MKLKWILEKRVFALLAFVFVIHCGATTAPVKKEVVKVPVVVPDKVEVKLLRVIDGDTIDVLYQGRKERVRFLNVDTPETHHPNQSRNIPLGQVVTVYAKPIIEKAALLELEFEGGRRRGKYGRLLAYVVVDGVNFNIMLVEAGMSPYYAKYGYSKKYHKEFTRAQINARQNKLVIWGDPDFVPEYYQGKLEPLDKYK